MTRTGKQTRRDYLPPDQYLTIEQIERLRKHTKTAADEARRHGSTRAIVNEMLIEIMLETGLRAEEICHLELRDLPTHHGKDEVLVREGKGKVLRVVKVKKSLRDKLNTFIKERRRGAKPGSPLFAGEAGYRLLRCRVWRNGTVTIQKEYTARLSYASLYSKIRGIGKAAGIPNLHPHTMRHTFGTHLHATEHDLRFVQRQMGHSRPETTARYAQVLDDAAERQTEALYSHPNRA